MEEIKKSMENLWKNPQEEEWVRFEKMIKKSNLKFYHVVYKGEKLKTQKDLKNAYVELYDAKMKEIGTVPLFMKKGGEFSGATIHMKGLLNANIKK